MSDERAVTRRRILQAVSSGSVAAVAGCIGGVSGDPCRDHRIDLSTGTTGFDPDPVGATDDDWRVTSSPDGTTGQAISVEPVGAWITLTTANWIDPYGTGGDDTWDPDGDYVYEIDFEIEDKWTDEQCELRIHQWAVDDDATIFLDGPSGTTMLAQHNTFSTLDGPVTHPVGPGQYTLRAELYNGQAYNRGSPSGLLLHGDVYCACEDDSDGEVCDLSIAKTHTGGSVSAGDTTEFEIEVCNEGTGTCRPGPVTVTDELPSGTTFVAGTGSDWTVTESGGTVSATHPQSSGLGPGDCLPTLTLELAVDPDVAHEDTLENCASVQLGDGEIEMTDCAEISVQIDASEDDCALTIAKTHDGSPVEPGDATAFEILVCNDGETNCTAPVDVVDALPSGVTYVSGTGTGWTITESSGDVTATHLNEDGLSPGDCLPTLTLEVEVGSIADTGETITNCATLGGSDGSSPSQSSCVDVEIEEPPTSCEGLEIEKVPVSQFTYGTQASYAIDICNTGEHPCEGEFTVTDELPDILSFVSASGSGWTVTESGGTVTATHQNVGLGPGDCLPTLTLVIDVASNRHPDATGSAQNCAQLFVAGAEMRESCVTHEIGQQ